jgi:hypothetical protein
MTDDFLHTEGRWIVKALPIYLGVQVITLLMTYLEAPVYVELYLADHNLPITGWAGIWFSLEVFGLATSLILLISQAWKMVLSARERAKLVTGYLLGVIAGLLTLGLRFFPIISPEYFFVVGGGALLVVFVSIFWIKRRPRLEEIFP